MTTASNEKKKRLSRARQNVESKEESISDSKLRAEVKSKHESNEQEQDNVGSPIIEEATDDFGTEQPEQPEQPEELPQLVKSMRPDVVTSDISQQRNIIKSDISQQSKAMLRQEKLDTVPIQSTKAIEKKVPEFLSKDDGGVITPIIEPKTISKKEAQLKLIEKLFASTKQGVAADGLKADNIQWLRQMLSSYDEKNAASVIKAEPQMQCRTG